MREDVERPKARGSVCACVNFHRERKSVIILSNVQDVKEIRKISCASSRKWKWVRVCVLEREREKERESVAFSARLLFNGQRILEITRGFFLSLFLPSFDFFIV